MATVRIGERLVGEGQPIYLVAEVGTTCLGDMDRAIALVEAGAKAGMDAVKFQLIDPEQVSDPTTTYTFRSGGQSYTVNMKEMFARLAFTEAQWREIAAACRRCGIDFFATEDFEAGVDLMDAIGVPAHKLSAWDTTYRPLIERMGASGRPTIVDLGPTTAEELADLVRWHQDAGGGALVLLHDYHTDVDAEMNLRAVQHLHAAYPQWPHGYSSPGRDDDIDMVAVGLGATMIEKRLILSRSDMAFHADESKEPAELADWVRRIRHAERALGTPSIRPSGADVAQKPLYYRSLCTLRPVKAGEAFAPDNLGGRRPGTGIPTARTAEFMGRIAARDLPENTLIAEADAR